MKIGIRRNGNDIETVTDFSDIESSGEISHFLCELELIKNKLLKKWEDWEDE